MAARYAIYFAPATGSPLAEFGEAWLGRCADPRVPGPRPPLDGFDSDWLDQVTAEPRRYGFHATLKAPFALAKGVQVADLIKRLGSFARQQRRFELPPLALTAIGPFLALVPDRPAIELDRLQTNCVCDFDDLRAPLGPDTIARRRRAGLTPRQDALLIRWGYPFVLEEFRFHLTLTGPIEDTDQRQRLIAALKPKFASLNIRSVPVGSIALFMEPSPDAPFRLLGQYPFGGNACPGR